MAASEIYWGAAHQQTKIQIGIQYEVNEDLFDKINFKITGYVREIDGNPFTLSEQTDLYFLQSDDPETWGIWFGPQIITTTILPSGTHDILVTDSFITPYFNKKTDTDYTKYFRAALFISDTVLYSGIASYKIYSSDYSKIIIESNLPEDVQNELNSDYPPPEDFYKVSQAGEYHVISGTPYTPPIPSLRYHKCTGWKVKFGYEEEPGDQIIPLNTGWIINSTFSPTYTFYPQWERLKTTLVFDYQDFPPLIAGKVSLSSKRTLDKGKATFLPQKGLDLKNGSFTYSYDFNFYNNNNLLDKDQYNSHFSYAKYFNYDGWKFKLGNVDNIISVSDLPQCTYPTYPWTQWKYEELYYPDEQNISLNYTLSNSEKVNIVAPTLYKKWYRHLGWFDTNNIQNAQIILPLPGKILDTTNLTEDITQTVYAGWTPKDYVLQFDPHFEEQQNYRVRNIPNSKRVSPKIEGSRLWFGYGEQEFPKPDWSTTIERKNNSNPILIQDSDDDTYTITYHYQDKEGTWQSKTEVVQNYVPFKYWTLTSEGTGTQYIEAFTSTSDDDVDFGISGDLPEGTATLFAQWDYENRKDGTILFNPMREGYRLSGWYKDQSSRTEDYKVGNGGDHWDRGESKQSEWHFYAEWEKIPCTITYNMDKTVVHNCYWGDNYQIIPITPTKDAETKTVKASFYRSLNDTEPIEGLNKEGTAVINASSFDKWTTATGELYEGGANAKSIYISDKTPGIVAEYDENSNIISLSLTLDPKWQASSSSFSIILPELESEENKVFLGWTIKEDGEDKSYEYGTSYNLKENENDFYAWWSSNKYTITYNTLGYELDQDNNPKKPDSQEFIPDQMDNVSLSKAAFYRPTTNKIYNITLYDWDRSSTSQKDFTITTTYGSKQEENEAELPRSTGWNTQVDGTGRWFGLGDSYFMLADVILYPYWIESKSTINLNDDNFIPDYPGHTLKGVYLNDVKIDENAFLPIEDNTTLTVKWNTTTYNIDYDANGGRTSSLPKPQIKEYDKDIELSTIAPSYMDKVFIGWQYLNIENTGPAAYEGEPTVTFSENSRTYTITWNNNDDTITKNIEVPIDYEESDYTIWYYLTNNTTTSIKDITKEGIWSKNKKTPESDQKLWTYVEITMGSKLYHPGDTYSENHDVTFIAQWREITTLTEWLSNWETTVASTNQDIPGNQLTLYTIDGEKKNPPNSYKDWNSLFEAIKQEAATNTNHLGYGYKLKLDLVNPYNDTDEYDKIIPLQRVIFVPAKMREENNKKIWYGIYETPSDVKILDVSLYDEAEVNFNYKLHYDLNNLINPKDAQFYEIIDSNVTGQISGTWSKGTDISSLIQSKYYGHKEENNMMYENTLDSWSFLSFEFLSDSSNPIKVNVSTINNSQLISYFLDEQGLYTLIDKEKTYADFDNVLIDKFIIDSEEVVNGIINYRATIIQKTYV